MELHITTNLCLIHATKQAKSPFFLSPFQMREQRNKLQATLLSQIAELGAI
jgi:hypothetical protein